MELYRRLIGAWSEGRGRVDGEREEGNGRDGRRKSVYSLRRHG